MGNQYHDLELEESMDELRVRNAKAVCQIVRLILLEIDGQVSDPTAIDNAVDRVIRRLK